MATSGGGWSGLQESTQHLPALGMGMMNLRDRQMDREAYIKIHQDQLAIQQEEEKRKATAFQYQEQLRQKKEAEDNAIVPASVVNPRIHDFPTQKQKLVEATQAAGYNLREEGGELYGPKKAFDYMGSLVKAGNEESAQYIKAGRLDLQNKAQGLIQQIGELKQTEKTDEKTLGKIAELDKSLMGVKMQIAQTFDIEDKVMEQSRINAAKGMNSDHLKTVGHDIVDVSDPKNPKVVHRAPFAPPSAGVIKPPSGYRFTPSGDLEPIPNGPADKKPKSPSSSDLKRLKEMVEAAGSSPDPNAIATIGQMADSMGYEYTQVETPGKLYGTNKEWQLIKKGGGQSAGSAYKSPEDVKAAFKAKKISEAEATKILQSQFGYK
jgi:hypothetical protein